MTISITMYCLSHWYITGGLLDCTSKINSQILTEKCIPIVFMLVKRQFQ